MNILAIRKVESKRSIKKKKKRTGKFDFRVFIILAGTIVAVGAGKRLI